MSAATALKEYRHRLAGLPASKFVGSLLWYSIAGTTERNADGRRITVPVRVHQDVLEGWFDELGLDKAFLPPKIKLIDAFRAASSQVKREYIDGDPSEGRYATLRVEEVKSDAEQVIRHIVKDLRDEKKERLARDHVATLKFIRGGRTAKGKRHSGDHVKYAVLSRVKGEDREQVDAIIDDFNERYEDLSQHLHSHAIRAIVRNILVSLNAVGMKTSGGLYFVHKSRWGAVDALQALVRMIGQGCCLEQFPMVDTSDSRDTITEAFQSEVEDQVRLLLKQIAEANAAKKVSPRRYAELNAAYSEIAGRSAEYSELLGLAQGRAADALEVAMMSVTELATRVDYGGIKK